PRPGADAARPGTARTGEPAGAGGARRAASGRTARPVAAVAPLHAAHQRWLRGVFRPGADRARAARSARRAAALRAETRQGQRAAARWQRGPGDGRDRRRQQSRDPHPGAVSRPLHRRGARRPSAGPWQGHGGALRRWPTRAGLAPRARQRPDRRGAARARPGARDRRDRRRVFRRPVAGARFRPDRQRARAPYRQPAGRDAQLRAAGRGAGPHRLDAVASAHGCRPRSPLAARMRAAGVRGL
ncbi:LOW QUALITY PROTEIN: LysR family Transcriptional regulator, partial [Achromobacter xylosoxidans C54]